MAFSALKRTLLAGATAVALGTAAFGITTFSVAGAQQAVTPTPSRRPPAAATAPASAPVTPGAPLRGQGRQRIQQFWDTVAAKLGLTPERLRQAIAEARAEQGLPRFGSGGPGSSNHFRGPASPGGRFSLDQVASALGISADQLRQEVPGKSLADVARAHNVDPTRVAEALKSAATIRIDQAVSAGRISANRAAELKQRTSARVDQLITRPSRVRSDQPRRPSQVPSGTSGVRP